MRVLPQKPVVKASVLAILFLCLSIQMTAQDHEHEHMDMGGSHVPMHTHNWEIGGAVGAVYNIKESHTAAGLHAHLIKNLGLTKKFGIGFGFETILDEHRHLNFGIPLNYNASSGFSFTVTPGVLFKKEIDWEAEPSAHFEVLYNFFLEHLHVGPMLELAVAQNDLHLMLGIHLGFGF